MLMVESLLQIWVRNFVSVRISKMLYEYEAKFYFILIEFGISESRVRPLLGPEIENVVSVFPDLHKTTFVRLWELIADHWTPDITQHQIAEASCIGERDKWLDAERADNPIQFSIHQTDSRLGLTESFHAVVTTEVQNGPFREACGLFEVTMDRWINGSATSADYNIRPWQ